jgi:SAM-dependent methyltransferase
MRLRRKPPRGRTKESLLNHYITEKQIAKRLRNSAGRDERRQILSTMYEELFRAVPDHPRLTRRINPVLTQQANESKLCILRPVLSKSTVFAEFGAGDCLFAAEAARHVNLVYAIDISDQRGPHFRTPINFRLVTYNGYEPPELEPSSVDVCFSDELIEHLHPEDIQIHLTHVRTILKPGGVYIFRTPHAQAGPDDISRFFSTVAEGFHLKEWTYAELLPVLRRSGLIPYRMCWQARKLLFSLPIAYFLCAERAIQLLPVNVRALPATLLVPSICCATRKTAG